jgi:hypothetical protein
MERINKIAEEIADWAPIVICTAISGGIFFVAIAAIGAAA